MLSKITFCVPAISWSSLGWRKMYGMTWCNMVLWGEVVLVLSWKWILQSLFKGMVEFCNCRECFDFGDFWCGFLVSVEENSGYTEINARLSLAQELGIHCWTECCCSNPVLKSVGKTGACLSSYYHFHWLWKVFSGLRWILCPLGSPKPYPNPTAWFFGTVILVCCTACWCGWTVKQFV